MNNRKITLSYGILLVALLLSITACHRHKPENVVRDFYYAYQNLDFEKAKTYCAPYMVNKLDMIKSGFTVEKAQYIVGKTEKSHIEIDTVIYNEAKDHATVKVSFTFPEDTMVYEDFMMLELRGEDWKVANF